MPRTPKAPPPWLIDAVSRVRAGLGFLHRSVVPPSLTLFELGQGAWLTQTMYVAAELGIADALRDGPRSADDVARQVGADPGATYRVMRALAANSLLKQRRDGRFALTRLGEGLRSDTPGSMAAMLKFVCHPTHWQEWAHLLHSVRTGEPAADHLHGMPIFDYLETDPDYASTFNDAMTGVSAMVIESLLPAYDFSDLRLVVDVGGGHGALLAAVLNQAPSARGVLFDLPSVVAGATPVLEAAGVRDRCEVSGGSFFESVPAGGDAYLLKTIIHDWAEESALTILRNVRSAIAADGKLLLVEMVLPDSLVRHPGMLLDLEMLVTVGGRERTADEYAELLSRAGFRLNRVVVTAGPTSIVEASPV